MSWLSWGQGCQLEFSLRIVSPLQEQGKKREGSCFSSLGFIQVTDVLVNNLPTEKEMHMLVHFLR